MNIERLTTPWRAPESCCFMRAIGPVEMAVGALILSGYTRQGGCGPAVTEAGVGAEVSDCVGALGRLSHRAKITA